MISRGNIRVSKKRGREEGKGEYVRVRVCSIGLALQREGKMEMGDIGTSGCDTI